VEKRERVKRESVRERREVDNGNERESCPLPHFKARSPITKKV